ncbi:M3 family metallopeptidase [Areca yellow leaf disease phytoplasma]|uniref:M3 family metallopeptidase n=1 Tax=Areca yellow leaf disease phytoplasma TaxID=927614 RepID=UPI0035B55727
MDTVLTFLNIALLCFLSNFNGTSHDVDVLTHEIGHAFQVYQSRHLIPEYRWPTFEAAEISSMGMEFLAYPWVKDFLPKCEQISISTFIPIP